MNRALMMVRTVTILVTMAVATLPGPFEQNDYPPDYKSIDVGSGIRCGDLLGTFVKEGYCLNFYSTVMLDDTKAESCPGGCGNWRNCAPKSMETICNDYKAQIGDYNIKRSILEICTELRGFYDQLSVPNRCISFSGPTRTRAGIDPDTSVEDCAGGCSSNGVCLGLDMLPKCTAYKAEWLRDPFNLRLSE